jgi:oligoribonuclease (3'-5' exoribonuclease)
MTSKHEHKFIYFTDLETTGSTLEDNEIIEIGAAITDMDLNIIDARDYVLPSTKKLEDLNLVVQDMHTKNHLWRDVTRSVLDIKDVDAEIADWIRSFNGSNHMAFAGSGVAHFDRQFYKRDLPLTNARLTYWALDIGSARRIYTLLAGGIVWPADTKTHRAIDDVYYHIQETKFFVNKLKEVV